MGLFVVREGEGEQDSLPSLVLRIRDHLRLATLPFIPRNGNWRKPLVTESQVREACTQIRGTAACQALLLTRDADNAGLPQGDCPRSSAPDMAAWVRDLALPFPAAVVLFYKEYETLFLAGAGDMAGKEALDQRGRVIATIPPGADAHPFPEHPRDAKGWVRDHLIDGYKPTLYQSSLTRLLDLDTMEASSLSSYRRLLSALSFLSDNLGVAGAVYPPGMATATDA